MADNVEPTVELELGTPEPQVQEDVFEFEIDDGTNKEPAVDPAELQARMDALSKEKEELQGKADSNAQMTAAFAQLAEKLGKSDTPSVPPQSEAGPPQVDVNWGELKEKVNDVAFKDPFNGFMQTIAPVAQQLNGKLDYGFEKLEAKNKLLDSKLALISDEGLQSTYGKYKGEIEALVGSGEKDYIEATQAVKMAHMDDIIAEKVAEAVAAVQPAVPGKAPTFTNSGNQMSAANAPKVSNRVAVTPRELQAMQQYALDKAMDPDDADDMKDVYQDFVNNKWIKR